VGDPPPPPKGYANHNVIFCAPTTGATTLEGEAKKGHAARVVAPQPPPRFDAPIRTLEREKDWDIAQKRPSFWAFFFPTIGWFRPQASKIFAEFSFTFLMRVARGSA
jgi:hypothetical protein